MYSAVPQWEVPLHGPRWQSHSPQHHNSVYMNKAMFTQSINLVLKEILTQFFNNIPGRKVTITGFDLKSYRQCLQKWNAAITAMNEQCDQLGCSKQNAITSKWVFKCQKWPASIIFSQSLTKILQGPRTACQWSMSNWSFTLNNGWGKSWGKIWNWSENQENLR